MTQRYVRARKAQGKVYYGSLHSNRTVTVFNAAPWQGGQLTNSILEADNYHLLAPCFTSKIIAVGRNYRAHTAELDNIVTQEPLLFLKHT